MPTGVVYFWGFVGGFVAALFVYVVPSIRQAALTGEINITKQHAFWMTVLVLVLSGIAGIVPLLFDDVSRAQAITMGLGSQASIKGFLTGVRETVTPLPPPPPTP